MSVESVLARYEVCSHGNLKDGVCKDCHIEGLEEIIKVSDKQRSDRQRIERERMFRLQAQLSAHMSEVLRIINEPDEKIIDDINGWKL